MHLVQWLLLARSGHSLIHVVTLGRKAPFWPAFSSLTAGIYRSTIAPTTISQSSGFLAQTSPRPSQVCEPKLRCHHEVVGSCVRNDAPMTQSALNRLVRA